jgi:hypothetical protein
VEILLLRCGEFTDIDVMEGSCHSALRTVAIGTNCYIYWRVPDLQNRSLEYEKEQDYYI